MKLAGKVALVTGGAKRLGKAIALGLAEAGANIVLHYHTSAQAAAVTAGEIRRLGVEVAQIQSDLSDPTQAAGVVAEGRGYRAAVQP